MPLPWGKSTKKEKTKENLTDVLPDSNPPEQNGSNTNTSGNDEASPQQSSKPKLVFHCQQAQGSVTGVISGFTNVKELYQKIADVYEIPASEILFCTLNTHKVDMTRLLGGQIGLEDFIFAHVKGRPKEIEINKYEDALGLTITDNGAGYAFIKRIKEGSVMDKVQHICVGDHIEKIDGESMVNCRHFEVAKRLKQIPKGKAFEIRVVEPLKTGFANIAQNTGAKKSGKIGTGKETLRLRSKGPATLEPLNEAIVTLVIEKINKVLDKFMEINDSELAQSIWELGEEVDNPSTFTSRINESELAVFEFHQDIIFDLWGAISDAKSGRLAKSNESEKATEFPETY